MKTKLLPIEKSIFAFFIIITIFSCKKEGITSVLTAVEKKALQLVQPLFKLMEY